MLFSIPTDVLVELLCNWLIIKELCFVNSCNKNERELLKLCYSMPKFLINNKRNFSCSSVNWLIKNKIKFTSFYLNDKYSLKSPFRYMYDNLTKFFINCPHMVDKNIVKIIKKCKFLTHLFILNVFNITNRTVVTIAKHCYNLKVLHIYLNNDTQINIYTLKRIIENCLNLELLLVHCRGNKNIPEVQLANLKNLYGKKFNFLK